MNRGSDPRRDPEGRRHDASMRPRFMNRGSPPANRGGARPPNGFNEAPIHESGKWWYPSERESAAR